MQTSLKNFFDSNTQTKFVIHPGSGKMTRFDLKPNFIAKKNAKYDYKFDITDIENYDVGIPFLVDQRALIDNNFEMKLIVIDQNYLANNNLTNFSNGFTMGLISSIIDINTDILVNKDNQQFVKDLKALVENIKNQVIQNQLGSIGYENLVISEFEKLYLFNREKFDKLYIEVNTKRVLKDQVVSLNNFLSLEKNKSDTLFNSNFDDPKNTSDAELFGRAYSFNLKTINTNVNIDNLDDNLFPTYFRPSKFDQISTDRILNGDNASSSGLIQKVYKNLIDPASIFKGEDIAASLYNQISGGTINKDIEDLQDIDLYKVTDYNDEVSKQLLDSVVNSKTRLNRTNQTILVDPDTGRKHHDIIRSEKEQLKDLKKKDTNYISLLNPSSNRIKKFFTYFNFSKKDLNKVKGDKFSIEVLSDGKVLSYATFKYAIHERFKSYLFENFNPKDINVICYKDAIGGYYLEINNQTQFDVVCNIELIKAVGTDYIYKDEKEIKINVNRQDIEVYKLEDETIYHENSSMFLRNSISVRILDSTYNIDNFETIKILQDNPTNRNTRKCTVFAYQEDLLPENANVKNSYRSSDQTLKINVMLYCDDPNFLSVRFYRRDVTFGSGMSYEQITDGFLDTSNFIDAAYFRQDTILEYIAEVMTVQGYSYYSTPTRLIVSALPAGSITCEISETGRLNLQKNKNQNSFIQEVFDLIKADQEEDLYNDDLKAINQATKEIMFAEVEVLKYNERTHCFYYESLGDYAPGDTISFRSTAENYFGSNFIKLTVYQSSPILVINLVNDLISKISSDVANNGDATEQSILLSKVKPVIDQIKNENRVNLLSREFLQEGIIPAAETVTDLLSSLGQIKKSVKINDSRIIATNYSGYKSMKNNKLKSINVKQCSYTRMSDKRLYIKFDLNMRQSDLQKIDFYIVMSEKDKIMTPVVSIKANKQNNFGFFDNTSISYSGEVKYHLLPVLMTGVISDSIFLKSIIVNEYRVI